MCISFLAMLIIAREIAVDRFLRMHVENIKKLLISLIFLNKNFNNFCMPDSIN
jgi:hypothetical protein